MRKLRYDYIPNVSLYRIRPTQLAQCLGLPARTVYALRNNRLRRGKANEVIHDLINMTDFDFLCRYEMRKGAIRYGWKSNND